MKILINLVIFFFSIFISSFAFSQTTKEIFVDPSQPIAADGGLTVGEVALTFDDGPNPVTTPKILETLKKFDIKATFFQIGQNAQSHPELTQQILNEGHSLGSHSWDHPNLRDLSLRDAVENIVKGHQAGEQATNLIFHTPFFRFPYFGTNKELDEAVKNLKLIPFFANIESGDWAITNPNQLLEHTLAEVETVKHGIILFHDPRPQTAEMLDAFLTKLIERNYKTVVFRAQH